MKTRFNISQVEMESTQPDCRVLYPHYVTQNDDNYTASSRRRLSESSLFHHFSGAVGAVDGTHIAFTPEHCDMS